MMYLLVIMDLENRYVGCQIKVTHVLNPFLKAVNFSLKGVQ